MFFFSFAPNCVEPLDVSYTCYYKRQDTMHNSFSSGLLEWGFLCVCVCVCELNQPAGMCLFICMFVGTFVCVCVCVCVSAMVCVILCVCRHPK